jgi:demethylmenaquinone methyltransferase/2-methoxy-6-polyprenyl-1,4-benzoquinol methylase
LPAIERPFCIDLACGTGDITRLLAEKYPQGRIVGVDIAEEMLWRAREHSRGHPVLFVNCDMSRLDLESESADIVTGGYALRNAPHLKQAIAEVHRVLKPGGVAAFLDFSKPEGWVMQKVEYALLKIWTGFWGLLFHRNAEVYGYIAESLRKFPDAGALDRLFYGQGFAILVSRFYFGGITRLLIVRKF